MYLAILTQKLLRNKTMLVIAFLAPFIDAARSRDEYWCSILSSKDCEDPDLLRRNRFRESCPMTCGSRATASANTTATTTTTATTMTPTSATQATTTATTTNATTTATTAALANVCKCVNGFPVMRENCAGQKAHECQFCFLGFHLDEDSKHCAANVCKCDHGAPVSSAECFFHGAIKCNRRSCDPGFHFESGDCEANECVCRHGSPVNSTSCSKNGANECDECIGNYHLGGETEKDCEPNVCTCVHGYPVTTENCRTQMANKCQWCFPGFHLNEVTKYCEVATTTTTTTSTTGTTTTTTTSTTTTTTTSTTTTTTTTTTAAISNCSCPNIAYYRFHGNYFRSGTRTYDGRRVYYYMKFVGDIASSKTSTAPVTAKLFSSFHNARKAEHKCYYVHNSGTISDPYNKYRQDTDYKITLDFDWLGCYHRFLLLSNDYDNSHCCCCSKAIVR